MDRIDPVWLRILSDLLINLAAGWIGAVIILPTVFRLNDPFDLVILTADLTIGIVSLVIAFRLQKLIKE